MRQIQFSAALCAAYTVFTCGATAEAAPANRFVVASAAVTDLGTLGGSQSTALDINDSGQIVGWSATAQGIKQAFRHSNGTMDDIGNAFGPNLISEASGINASGQIVGTMTDQFGTIGFVWDGGFVDWLFAQRNSGAPTHAAAINDSGDACGDEAIPDDESLARPGMAVAWMSNGTRIGARGSEHANDINSSSMVVGRLDFFSFMMRWTMTSGGSIANSSIIPSLQNYWPGDALAVNDRGDVVGYSISPFGSSPRLKHAFLWDGSTQSQDLGVFLTGSNSVAEDINEKRFVAGHADERVVNGPFNFTRERAFIYHANFGMVALPALSVTTMLGSCQAYALNELDTSMVIEVVGACDTPVGAHAVRWDVTIGTVPLFPGH